MAFDPKTVSTVDWGVMGAAAGVFLFSLFSSYVTLSFDGDDEVFGEYSSGVSAWNSYATLGVLLLLAVGALAAARVFAGVALPDVGVGWNLIAAAVAGLGTLLVILRAFTYPDGFGIDVGPGWSGYVLMLLALVETAFAVLAFRTSGEQAPWQGGGGRPPSAPTYDAPPRPPTSSPGSPEAPSWGPPPSGPPPSPPPPTPPPATPPPAAPPPVGGAQPPPPGGVAPPPPPPPPGGSHSHHRRRQAPRHHRRRAAPGHPHRRLADGRAKGCAARPAGAQRDALGRPPAIS